MASRRGLYGLAKWSLVCRKDRRLPGGSKREWGSARHIRTRRAHEHAAGQILRHFAPSLRVGSVTLAYEPHDVMFAFATGIRRRSLSFYPSEKLMHAAFAP